MGSSLKPDARSGEFDLGDRAVPGTKAVSSRSGRTRAGCAAAHPSGVPSRRVQGRRKRPGRHRRCPWQLYRSAAVKSTSSAAASADLVSSSPVRRYQWDASGARGKRRWQDRPDASCHALLQRERKPPLVQGGLPNLWSGSVDASIRSTSGRICLCTAHPKAPSCVSIMHSRSATISPTSSGRVIGFIRMRLASWRTGSHGT